MILFSQTLNRNTLDDVKLGETLTVDEKLQLKTLLLKYASLFGRDKICNAKTRHYIRTSTSQPIKCGITRLSKVKVHMVKEEIKEM